MFVSINHRNVGAWRASYLRWEEIEWREGKGRDQDRRTWCVVFGFTYLVEEEEYQGEIGVFVGRRC